MSDDDFTHSRSDAVRAGRNPRQQPEVHAPEPTPSAIPPNLEDDELNEPEDAAPASDGQWRRAEPDEIFEPGRSFCVDVNSGQTEVLEPADASAAPQTAPTLLDMTLDLAARGIPVFPCDANKRPLIKGGKEFSNASTDPDRIREMWEQAGPAAKLVGVPTGRASGFDVLDVDPRHNGEAWEIENSDRLGESRMHGPPSGGRHYLYRHADGVRNIQDGKTIAPGIDVRGQGGYVCFPPSGGYSVIHDAKLADWPDWLLPLVRKAARPPPPPPDPASYATPERITENRLRGFIDREIQRVRDAPVGARHGARLAASRSIGGIAAEAGLSDSEVEEMLIAARPPEIEEEKERRTIRDGIAYGRATPIDLNTLPDSALFRRHRLERGNGAAPEGDGGEAPDTDEQQEPEWNVPPGWAEARPPAEGDIAVPSDPLLTEQVAMEAFITGFHTDLRFNHSSNSWLVWTNHYWKPDQRKLAFAWALKLCRQLAAQGVSTKGRLVVEKVRFSAAVEQGARAMPPFATAQEDWDNDPWLLGTPGGVVDLKTGILRPGERSDMITMTTACTPANNEDCPLWLQFLNDAMQGDKAMIGFLQRYDGYCLTGLTMEEVILFLFGPGGAGKGTVVKTTAGIMGDYAITAPMEVFTSQAFRPSEYYRADMAGKRLIVAAETEQGAYWAEAFVKEITGGDRLSGRHPSGRPFTFDPTHKPLLHGNHMPKLRGRSTAMERRLRIALFNHKPAIPDPALKEKLRAEWPGILRWMINGCLKWQRDGLQPPPAVADANKRYFDAQDVLGRWIEDCCILDKNLQETSATLRHSFNHWARANDEEEMNGNNFAEILALFEDAPLKRVKDRDGKRWIRGIGLQVTLEQQSQQRARQGDRDA